MPETVPVYNEILQHASKLISANFQNKLFGCTVDIINKLNTFLTLDKNFDVSTSADAFFRNESRLFSV